MPIALLALLAVVPAAQARENLALFFREESPRARHYEAPLVQHFTDEVIPERAVAAWRYVRSVPHRIAVRYDDATNAVADAAIRNNVPVELAIGIAKVESGLNPHARNRSGAAGLMQIMPSTARGLGCRGNLYEAQANAECGVRYLAQIYRDTRGNMRLTAARYNQGRFARRISRSAAVYASRVLARTHERIASNAF